MATTLNVSGLSEYVNIHKDELLTKATLGVKSLDYIEIMPNVKYKDALNYLDSTVVLQDGSQCGWNPQGSDVFTERYIETKAVEVEKEYCWKDFEKTYANYQLLWEAGRETLPFEEKIANSNLAAIQEAVEDLIWQGDSGLGITGLIKDAEDASASTVDFESGMTVTAKVDAMVAGLSARMLKKGVNIFMSFTDFRNYVLEANGTCCANRPVLDAAAEAITYAGDSRIKLIPVYGLEETGVMIAATADAMVYATDIEGSENVYRMWFDEKNEVFCFRVLFRAGTAIKLPDEVVVGAEA